MKKHYLPVPPLRGFTLVELLVVVGIMAVMLSVAAVGIQNIDKGQATVSAISQTQALMDEARNLAVGRGTRARLCIHAEPGEEDRNLRFLVVAYEQIERNESGEETGRNWRVDSWGTYLPNGVYFHPKFSQQASGKISGLGTFGTRDEAIRFPGNNKSTRNPNYYYYEFNAEGLSAAQGENQPGAACVLVRGITGPGADQPRMIGKDAVGFVVWRNGRTSAIRDLDFILK